MEDASLLLNFFFMKTLNIGLIGSGVVGQGVIDLLNRNSFLLTKRSGVDFKLRVISSRNILKKKINSPKSVLITDNYNEVIDDEEVDVVVELIGGTTDAYQLIKKALKQGKHVVTANKAVLSKYGDQLFKLACKHQVELFFESAIGGGIPIIKVLRESLAGNHIKNLYAIINGTTNYILSEMMNKKANFQESLKRAKELGFAESDPTLDINGSDSAHKMGLLSLLAFNSNVVQKDIFFEGIENLEIIDIEAAKNFGYKIKLLGIARDLGKNNLEVRVHPTLILRDHELAGVEEEYNAVYIESDFLGSSLYYGKGAGAYPTASAVVSDLNDLAHLLSRDYEFNPYRYQPFQKKKIIPITQVNSKYYIRLLVREAPGVLAKITSIFATHQISIESLVQKNTAVDIDKNNSKDVSILLITHQAMEERVRKSLKKINSLKDVRCQPIYLRICDFS